jgi:SNF2 family DNA or RNA helicase
MKILYDYQLEAISRMKDGCILCGDVGTGKSLTALAYYFTSYYGILPETVNDVPSPMQNPAPLYIITTARKRDTFEWDFECNNYSIAEQASVVIDSWNNIGKYTDVKDAFFIFDEQRVVGYGAWTKSFLKITKNNRWILLSATPGDTWSDYIPVFIANGFYKNKTDFTKQHIVYSRFTKYPKIDHYISTGKLISQRRSILVTMEDRRKAITHHEEVLCEYDRDKYKEIMKERWDPYKEQPIADAGGLCYCIRQLTNSDKSRLKRCEDIISHRHKVIIFYNFDYELEALRKLCKKRRYTYAEWNGHKHEPIPKDKDVWVYLVQYTAGAEGWNCTETDTIIFFSQNYSYKIMAQAAGRINRMNTPFTDLYYYHLKSRCPIDLAISRAIMHKQNFNESAFADKLYN